MRKERIDLLFGILFLIAVVGGVYLLAPARKSTDVPIARGIETPPPITAELAARIQQSTGFDVLVSYTERGFEPASVTISRGQTVRFVNNKQGASLWVAAVADHGAIYPGRGDECGQSAFDSCGTIAPGEFWEFTFTRSGTWSFKNNATPSDVGTIIVR